MAHMRVQQRTPNISIHQATSAQNGNSLSLSHPFDDPLSVYNSNSKRFFQFFQRIASEPQTPVYHSTIFPFSNTVLPTHKPKVNDYDCDKSEPVITKIANRFVF